MYNVSLELYFKKKLIENVQLKNAIVNVVKHHKNENKEIEKYYTFCEEIKYERLLPLLEK